MPMESIGHRRLHLHHNLVPVVWSREWAASLFALCLRCEVTFEVTSRPIACRAQGPPFTCVRGCPSLMFLHGLGVAHLAAFPGVSQIFLISRSPEREERRSNKKWWVWWEKMVLVGRMFAHHPFRRSFGFGLSLLTELVRECCQFQCIREPLFCRLVLIVS